MDTKQLPHNQSHRQLNIQFLLPLKNCFHCFVYHAPLTFDMKQGACCLYVSLSVCEREGDNYTQNRQRGIYCFSLISFFCFTEQHHVYNILFNSFSDPINAPSSEMTNTSSILHCFFVIRLCNSGSFDFPFE